MANRVKKMQTVRAILQLMHRQVSLNKIAGQLHLARRTVRKYAKIARKSSYQLDELPALDDPSLCAVMYPPAAPVAPDINSRCAYFLSRMQYYAKELKRTGVTRQLLWKEYQQDYPVGYSYSQFCHLLAQHQEYQEYLFIRRLLLDRLCDHLFHVFAERGQAQIQAELSDLSHDCFVHIILI